MLAACRVPLPLLQPLDDMPPPGTVWASVGCRALARLPGQQLYSAVEVRGAKAQQSERALRRRAVQGVGSSMPQSSVYGPTAVAVVGRHRSRACG